MENNKSCPELLLLLLLMGNHTQPSQLGKAWPGPSTSR
jgi:hypothetical protein